MRVAVHAGQLLQRVPGGIGRYTHALLRGLPAAGVDAIAFAAGRRPPDVPGAVPWIDLGRPHGSARYELWHRIRRPAVRLGCDVVHAPSLAIPPVEGAPLVATVHDVAFLRMPEVTTRRGARFHRQGLELARRAAALVVTPSAFTRFELLQEGFDADHVLVAPLGVSPPLDRDAGEVRAAVAATGMRHPYVLTVGTVEPRKDLPTMVAAVERLRRTHPALRLAIVGPRGWGEVRGIDREFVDVLGELPWRTVDALVREALVCCVASRYEGFGLPVLEALARGAPVVATDGSALAEVVADAGLRFPAGDVDALAEQLARVVDDESLRADLAVRGRERAAAFTWEASIAAHARVFAQAVALGAAPT